MLISRRNLLRHMATGAAATAAVPSLAKVSLGAVRGGARLPEGAARTAQPIRLSRNENAYGPSANVTATMQEAALNAACRYPELEVDALRNKVAALHGVTPDRIVLGCGSSDIMRIVVDSLVGPGRKLVAAL